MNKKKIIVLLLIVLSCVGIFRAGMIAGASSGTPGSSGDPLITKSYLDQRLSKFSGGSDTYSKVTVKKGKSLYAKEGTEFMIYSGSATVVGAKGIVNVTSGELFKKGNTAVMYSLYISPANTSGIKTSGETVIYIKGEYTIE